MQKKALLAPIIAFISLAIYSSPSSFTLAATPSASPSPSPVSINEVTENLKKRLQDSLDTPVAASPSPSASARAYIGIVKDVIKDTVIIEDKDGKKDIKLQDETTILRSPGTASIKSENIRIDDYIIAIGYLGEEDVMDGLRLIVSADPIQPPAKRSGQGTIQKITKSGLTLKLSDKTEVLATTAKTIFKSSVATIDYSELAIGDTLIYTATQDAKEALTATVIMRTQTASISE